ncbi:MAG: hypothetical protein IH593_06995 [Bacteroidales bacterium]|nr:hypothetical protein [Bacteroidales bacterium]
MLHNTLYGMPDLTDNKTVINRKNELKSEAAVLLGEIKRRGADMSDDPWSDPKVLSSVVMTGLLDTPHFRGNHHLRGEIMTREINGAWYAVDRETGEPMTENERIGRMRV